MLGLVMFSVVLGTCIGKMREKGKPLLGLFETLSEAMMIITSWVIWISPIGVLFLVAAKLLEMASFVEVLGQLGWYFMTVMLGLMLHGFGTYRKGGYSLAREKVLQFILPLVSPSCRYDFGHLLPYHAQDRIPVHCQDEPGAGHCLRYRFELGHDAHHDPLPGQYGH